MANDNPQQTPSTSPNTGIPGSTTDLGVQTPEARKVDARPRDGDSDYAPDELNTGTGNPEDPEAHLSRAEKHASRSNPNEPQLEFSPERTGPNHAFVDIVTYIANEYGLTPDNARDVMVNLKSIKIHDEGDPEGKPLEADARAIPVEDIDGKIVSVVSTNRSMRFKYAAN
jgi:hypothetical protein